MGACPGEKGTVALSALKCHLAAVTAPGEWPCAAASWCPDCSKGFSCPWRWETGAVLARGAARVAPPSNGVVGTGMGLLGYQGVFPELLRELCACHLYNPCVVFVVHEAGVNLSEENPVWGISPSPCELLSPHLCRCLRQL